MITDPGRRDYGSWLLGSTDRQPRSVVRRTTVLMALGFATANIGGAAGVFLLVAFVLPTPDVADRVVVWNLVAVAIAYVAMATVQGFVIRRVIRRRVAWVLEQRPPSSKEQRATLRVPVLVANLHLLDWGLAVAGFAAVNSVVSGGFALAVLLAGVLGGVLTAGYSYLLAEFTMRPLSARALASGPPPGRLLMPGVRTRVLFAWFLGSVVPVLGMLLVALGSLAGPDVEPTRFAVSVLALGGIVLVVGPMVLRLAARATADPVRGLRAAVERVEQGELDVEVPVYDTSDVGQLQAGFNRMTAGLRERERLRDLFGRHVGPEVVEVALAGGLRLGGEVREVAVLMVDLVGSTTLAATRPAEEVVELLNRFFAVAVEVAEEHGGLVNQLQGDAALVVFGAPTAHPDPAAAALRAACALVGRLTAVPELKAGVGVSFGPVVAGNIGAEQRHAYTVIGDAVNEAARLTEVAKALPRCIAASSRVVDAAGAEGWVRHDTVVLRGRTEPTEVMTPA